MPFKPVNSPANFPEIEKQLLEQWYSSGLVRKYLHKNDASTTKFSFLDGPITANNPMGVHHAWGRTYKDLWQRYHTMKGAKQRYQNGFDCQGLWVEVEVEKELGFKTKKDIENYGVANFVNKCKDRVIKYSGIQTEQSKHLGYFMDWDHSYFTMSDENNYAIWGFIKTCWQRGWLYKGHESIPWCPRCETAISQHEILTEDYKEVTHDSIYFQLPLVGFDNEFLLVWTTTPWTLPANIAVAVDKDLDYALVEAKSGHKYWLAADLVNQVFKNDEAKILKTQKGVSLVGLKYRTAFDNLEAVNKVATQNHDNFHIVIATDPQLMPITTGEGTGLVHTAVSAGEEDFKLGKKLGLPLIPVIADNADYLPGLGQFTGKNAKTDPHVILNYLEKGGDTSEKWVFAIVPYTHRYPACWRCKTELVWKVADEWYIAMDKEDPSDSASRTLRQEMMDVAKQIHWLPEFGLDRELDWLKNMHDWLISKKNRYWGLALPIYECPQCHNFEVIGDKPELQNRAVAGWDKFAGNSPHKPWIDEVKIKCSQCGSVVERIKDVGNPWLDAGIVPFSTLPEGWFPADFITESFPGQFKNWFYSLIAMSTVLKKTAPFKSVLGYASLLDEKGQAMHKSAGNMIEFIEGADKIGVDVMRWMYVTQNPYDNLLFGYKKADETRRRFHLMLWNVYNFFVTYANIDNFAPIKSPAADSPHLLDRWITIRLNQTISRVTQDLDNYDAFSASHTLEDFVSDLSLWYVRRSRDRVGPTATDASDKQNCYQTFHNVLVVLSQLLAPFMPFMPELIYTNLTGSESVHLSNWPTFQPLAPADEQLLSDIVKIRKIVELGLAKRKEAQIKVRQPLRLLTVNNPAPAVNDQLLALIKDELNVKQLEFKNSEELSVTLDTTLDSELTQEGEVREMIRSVQELRKQQNARLDQAIKLTVPNLPQSPQLMDQLRRQTLAIEIVTGPSLSVELQ